MLQGLLWPDRNREKNTFWPPPYSCCCAGSAFHIITKGLLWPDRNRVCDWLRESDTQPQERATRPVIKRHAPLIEVNQAVLAWSFQTTILTSVKKTIHHPQAASLCTPVLIQVLCTDSSSFSSAVILIRASANASPTVKNCALKLPTFEVIVDAILGEVQCRRTQSKGTTYLIMVNLRAR